jgi:hypothetical protein
MARSSVNNAIRSELADIADLLLDLGGAKTTTGSGNAYLLTLDTTPTALADNLLFLATSHHTNTSSATLNLNGLGTKAIKKLAAGTTISLGAQDFPTGHVGIFVYSTGSNCFLMLNPGTALLVGAEAASFEARGTAVTAATAGTIPGSLDIIEVLGNTTPGDDTNRPYTRELADPGSGDRFVDNDGTWWVAAAQGLHRVDGVASLRSYAPIDGRRVMLAYHTTAGDLGAGWFCGATGAAVATFADNDGTIIVPTGGNGSAAWLRIWDGLTAHVGWFGATCDCVTDDYAAVKKCLGLFTNGKTAIKTGAIDIGPGFAFGTPLIYGGGSAYAIRIFGHQSLARGAGQNSQLVYIGPVTEAAIIFYGANESFLSDVNVEPGNALNGVVCTSDNTYVATLSSGAAIGTHAVTPSNLTSLYPGCFLGVDAGGDNFEIVFVQSVNTGAGTFTATFAKSHAVGVPLGGSAGSSGLSFFRCRFVCPESPVWTTTTTDTAAGTVTITPGNMAGIGAGMPIRIGSGYTSEIVHPLTVGGSSFTAVCNQAHVVGERVMCATAGILFGNRMLLNTVQVSEITLQHVYVQGAVADRCYAGIRQNLGGNVKNFNMYNMKYNTLIVPFAFEQSSGHYLIDGCVGAASYDTIIVNNSAIITVIALEDESTSMWLRGNAGANAIQATFIGCTFQGQAPSWANDEMVIYSGALTFIGCDLKNWRVPGTSLPKIVSLDVDSPIRAASLAIINCFVMNATPTSGFIRNGMTSAGGGIDVIADGTSKLTMLGNIGGTAGALESLSTILPPTSRWQSTVVGLDEASIAAGGVSAIHAAGVSGAVMGDLVEASFSLDLQGLQLQAWVGSAGVVNYQFYNPRGGPIDLGSGDVKLRVRK